MRTTPAILFLLLSSGLAYSQKAEKSVDTPIKLTVKGVTLTTMAPAAWGKGVSLPAKAEDDSIAYVPVIDESMPYSGIAFTKPAPKRPDAANEAVMIALASVPAKFQDDEGATGKEEELDPYALSAVQKQKALDQLIKISTDKTVNAAEFLTPEMDSPTNLVGGWWGSPDAVLDVLTIEYFQTDDGAYRGAAYFYVEGQDISFGVSYRIALYNPETRTVLLAGAPLSGFPEVEPYEKAVIAASTNDADVMKAYHKGEEFIRDRSAWKESAMGKLVEQLEITVRKSVLAK